MAKNKPKPDTTALKRLYVYTARYKLQPGVEVFGRIENVFDADYQEVYGFETAGIAAYAGLKLTFGGEDGIGSRK